VGKGDGVKPGQPKRKNLPDTSRTLLLKSETTKTHCDKGGTQMKKQTRHEDKKKRQAWNKKRASKGVYREGARPG